MDVSRAENLPPPPSIINSIKTGFDLVAANITAILLPLLLNLFFWLGSRLRMDALFAEIKPDMVAIWQSGGISTEDINRALEWYESAIPSINLFWLLRAIPVGISSLPFSQSELTPLGAPALIQVSGENLMGWLFLLNVAGWILGSLYFLSVANLVLKETSAPRITMFRAAAQTIMLSIAWVILLLMIAAPIFLVLAILLRVAPFLGQIFVIVVSLASMWVIVPLFFWAHGIFLKQQNVLTALLASLKMTRYTLPSSSMFVLAVFVLSFGLNFLWSIPPQDSWMALVGIFGHSFISAALLASSFIYYRDVNIWLQTAIEKFGEKNK